jgi:2-keto-4-pentenoate hydratase/2-oxohepta-3-ene-1,7-dioic acid hydratase in catechol pathway
MKLLSYRLAGDPRPRCGAVLGDHVVDLTELCATLPMPDPVSAALAERGLLPAPGGLLRLLQAGAPGLARVADALAQAARPGGLAHAPRLDAVTLLAPVPRPGKVVAIGRNYGEHARESGTGPFEAPRLIAKLPSSVVGPNAVITPPREVVKLDFEVELAVVIGAFAHRVPREGALDVVAGYTVLDDLSAREFQFDVTPPQTTFAKSMDQFCPMGPWLVTADEIPDPQALRLSCEVNGVTMQSASTAEMLFPVAELIAYITQFMTLEPGDVIATGTPAGVGVFRKPPVWLRTGDRIRMSVERIGTIAHEIGPPA